MPWENSPVELHQFTCEIKEFSALLALLKVFDVCFTEPGYSGHFPRRQRPDSENTNTSVFIKSISEIFGQLPSNHSGTKFNPNT